MSALMTTTTVGDLVARNPELSRIFERLGIDYCCGGKKTLAEACRARGMDPKTVTVLLNAGIGSSGAAAVDVSGMSLSELADHIEKTHHAYLKTELPRLSPLIEKIAARHGADHLGLTQLPFVFSEFRSEMETHMAKEERVLFPLIRALENGSGDARGHCGGIENPIRVMELEHQHAGDALGAMRRLTDDFAVPDGACNTYRAVMQALSALEADLHQHVHKENNILFPQAIRHADQASVP